MTSLKVFKRQSSQTDEEESHMSKVSYAFAVRSLMYIMVCTRPNIAHAVRVVSRFLSNPRNEHWEGVKWILRYLKGTLKMHLSFRISNLTLLGFFDADLGGDLDGRKNTCYIFTLGGITISWKYKLQGRVSLSTIEVDYVVILEAVANEMTGLKNLIKN